jgi:NADH-quinone oxidoreductase subunit J
MAVAAVVCALGMLFTRNPVHAALWLVGNFVALAVIYLILSAPLLFALQLVVYAGAIMVLFLFVIMFFMSPAARRWVRPSLRGQRTLGGLFLGLFFLLLMWGMNNAGAFLSVGSTETDGMAEQFIPAVDHAMGQPGALGMWMFNYQVLPFELIGVLLVIALLGAVMVARDRRAEGMEDSPGAASGQGQPSQAEARE